MEPHMINNYISVLFVIVVNHVGFKFTYVVHGLSFNTFTKVLKKMNISKFNDITYTDRKPHSGLLQYPSSQTVLASFQGCLSSWH